MTTEEQFIDFKCPYCGGPISFPADHVNTVQECPGCLENVVVPGDGGVVGRKLPVPITTARLVLRRLRGQDWKDLLEFLSDEEMFRLLEGRPLDEEQITRWLESDNHVRLTTTNQPFCFGMQEQATGKLIGYVSLSHAEPQLSQATLSVMVNRQYQRKGFAAEAVTAVLNFCFQAAGLHRVAAFCDSRNSAAGRLFEKCGMRREGEFRQDRWVDGEWVNTVWHAMLRADRGTGQS